RKDDVQALADVFLKDIGARRGLQMTFAPDAVQMLLSHNWPGNVRELKNVIERAASLCDGPNVRRADLMFNRDASPPRQSESSHHNGNHGGGNISVGEMTPGLD